MQSTTPLGHLSEQELADTMAEELASLDFMQAVVHREVDSNGYGLHAVSTLFYWEDGGLTLVEAGSPAALATLHHNRKHEGLM